MHLASHTAKRTHFAGAALEEIVPYIDPLDPDGLEDMPLVVTRRQLIRLAVVSTEVGARFQRDAVDHDGMAWMLAPRALFDGRDAIDAALEQHHCIRALLLHGLGLGLDARPADIDELIEDRMPKSDRHGRGRRSTRASKAHGASGRKFASAN